MRHPEEVSKRWQRVGNHHLGQKISRRRGVIFWLAQKVATTTRARARNRGGGGRSYQARGDYKRLLKGWSEEEEAIHIMGEQEAQRPYPLICQQQRHQTRKMMRKKRMRRGGGEGVDGEEHHLRQKRIRLLGVVRQQAPEFAMTARAKEMDSPRIPQPRIP